MPLVYGVVDEAVTPAPNCGLQPARNRSSSSSREAVAAAQGAPAAVRAAGDAPVREGAGKSRAERGREGRGKEGCCFQGGRLVQGEGKSHRR